MNINKKKPFIICCCIINIVGIWIALAIQIHHDYLQTRKAAETSLHNLTRAFEEHVVSEIQDIDKLLLNFRSEYREGFKYFQSELRLLEQLGYEKADIHISAIDRHGRLIYSNTHSAPQGADFGSREYFLAQRTSERDNLFISRPEMNQNDRQWGIHFTRKLYLADGSFGGILDATVATTQFSDFFQTVDIGANGAITLFGTDLVVRSRASGSKTVHEVNGTTVAADHPAISRQERSGIFFARSAVDAVQRLSAYKRLDKFPLIVQVELAEKDIFGPATHRRNNILIFGIFITLALAAALALLLWFEKQQQLLADKISRREEQLQTTLDELEMLVTTDPLTELPNRRSFFSRAQAELTRTARYNRPLALIMLDLDHFKEVNDRYGHLAGDAALQHVSAIMRKCIREADMVARYGGEEFVIILPETEEAGAVVIAERVRSELEKSPLPIDSGGSLTLTASMGLACTSGDAAFADIDKLLQSADDAMYRAKASGRNCLIVAGRVD